MAAGLLQFPVGSTCAGFIIDIGAVGVTDDAAGTGLHTFGAGVIVGPASLDNIDADPSVNMHLDWMWWEYFHWNQRAGDNGGIQVHRRIKSMRKLGELNQDVMMFVNGVTSAGAISYNFSTSLLMLLP